MRNTVIQNCVFAGTWNHKGYYLEPVARGVEKPGTATITGASVVFDDFVIRCETFEDAANVLHEWLESRLATHGF